MITTGHINNKYIYYLPIIALDLGWAFSGFFSGFDFSTILAAAFGLGSGLDFGWVAGLLSVFDIFLGESDSELFSGENILFFLFGSLFFTTDFLGFWGSCLLLTFTAVLELLPLDCLGFELTFAGTVELVFGTMVALLFGLTLLFLLTTVFLSSSSEE